MANVPPRVAELVEIFDRNIETYKKQPYNEAQLRREFIDPFFEELGWDITNKGGLAQAYKDVIHEDAIKIGGYTKAPDYCFRIGGTRKFFLEAKKPSIDIKGDPHPAYQLRRYAWSAKLPLSILTDFEEFAVYDCQIRPKQTDRADTARIMYLDYKQYPGQWRKIADIFSKGAILKGSFDKFAAGTKGKRGTATVDKEFLAEIEKWRKMLARTITIKNISLSRDEINFAVQRTIDRILFLRMCEDRSIELYAQLLALSTGRESYQRLCKLFRQADAKYNSGLFHFRHEKGRAEGPDELTLNLVVDDTPLQWILHSLYYPQCPYEFSVLPAEILGNVYEQFLGKVIRITPGHQAKIEEKPEVKKAGGVYYTPSYIVDYIVKNTVGKLCEGKDPKQISKLKILDPACGSGSFLLGAYTHLLNHHRDWYVENNPKKHTKQIYRGKGAQWFLTITEKKRILLNNIFGVDIDSQAVEVTKLSLLLKVLEGETQETLPFRERALPDLGNNIKCGNSLIGPDFYDNIDPDSVTDDLRRKINPFDWKAEFPKIFSGKNIGFNAIIGNPPYGAKLIPEERKYLKHISKCGSTDTAALFIEYSIKLLNPTGKLGFIIPKPFIYASNWNKLRQKVLPNLELIADVSKVWKQVKLEQCIILLSQQNQHQHYNCYIREESSIVFLGSIDKSLFNNFGFILNAVSPDDVSLALRLRDFCVSLSHFAQNKRGGMLQRTISKDGDQIVLGGKHIQRWYIRPDKSNRVNKSLIKDDKAFVKQSSLLVQNIVAHIQNPIDHIKIIATVLPESDLEKYVILDTVNQLQCIPSIHPNYICAILNSKFLNWYAYRFLFAKAIRTMHFDAITTNKLLIPELRSVDKSKQVRIVELVGQTIDFHYQLDKADTPQIKIEINRRINYITQQIDLLIYEIYRLNDSEIELIESNSP